MAFDLRGIDEELIDYLSLYADAILKMGAGDDDYVRMAEREANCTGGVRQLCPSEGGLIGNAITPGNADIFGHSWPAISCCLRLRSDHGTSVTNEIAMFTGFGRSSPGATTMK